MVSPEPIPAAPPKVRTKKRKKLPPITEPSIIAIGVSTARALYLMVNDIIMPV